MRRADFFVAKWYKSWVMRANREEIKFWAGQFVWHIHAAWRMLKMMAGAIRRYIRNSSVKTTDRITQL